MMRNIYLICSFIALVFTGNCFSQNTGSLPILQHNVDAISSGTGNAFMGLSKGKYLYTDPTSFFDSDAKIYADYDFHLYSKIGDTNNRSMVNAFSAGYKINKNSVFIGFRHMGLTKKINMVNENGDIAGSIRPSDYTIDLGYSRQLSEQFSAYIISSYIHSSQNLSGNTFSFSGGFYFRNKANIIGTKGNYGLGLSFQDFGKSIKYDNRQERLPANINFGGFIQAPFNSNHKVSLLASGKYFTFEEYDNEFILNGGLEYTYQDMLSLRTGINHGFSASSTAYTIGAGYIFKCLSLNLAYSIAGGGKYTDIFQIGIGVKF